MSEEEILDIKRENYKLRKENFELIQDNVKLQEEKHILHFKLQERTVDLGCSIKKSKISDKIRYLDIQQRLWKEDRELKNNTDREICFARDTLKKLLEEE